MVLSIAQASLPLELEREIFELAAWHDQATSLALVLVASRVRIWIEPLLHRVIYVKTPEKLLDLQRRLENYPAHAPHIRHLLITSATTEMYPAVQYLLHACANLVHFGFWMDDSDCQPGESLSSTVVDCWSASSARNFRQLSMRLEDLVGHEDWPTEKLTSHLAPLTSVTHLDLIDFAIHLPSILRLLRAPVLPALRYLAIGKARMDDYREIMSSDADPGRPLPLRVLCAYGDAVGELDEDETTDFAPCPFILICIAKIGSHLLGARTAFGTLQNVEWRCAGRSRTRRDERRYEIIVGICFAALSWL
ncbi:hypothetical protein HMN09_00862200 [Mycena chlorophos]|uniref:Uncharacterized protein n=1 Tax=Mycena chlorophos TaxID=658473 RepID=A0A8H6W6E5_MYCCL|nr:hypothetical protein HMN09_00862200 [Mycena chlorophos]